uniref:UTP-monosaccharide-1-phosphate uridylyltransferase n=1 Tax=Trieres chinensis TaxID=1514140 RepID=A0A7S2ERR0_TRICV|mmetsp:Transcript_35471/g.72580  ORF Transcript_35471/g.72580 Transcript_35471/m.72580 type:complete len:689 (+) Transcript_35471:1-2067(+)
MRTRDAGEKRSTNNLLELLGEGTDFTMLNERQKKLANALAGSEAGQSHLFEGWSNSGASDDDKRRLMTQLEGMDRGYPSGGLVGYIQNAKVLLEKSKKGVNPLEGWKPSVPKGENFELGTKEFDEAEALGLKETGKCGFVLVAGGLGERLGYGGIKIGLPTELTSGTTYIQYYIETILSYQSKHADPGFKLPLCIMTSGDTNAKTVDLLEKNSYFGMDRSSVTIVQQGDGVPALENNDAKIAVDPADPYAVQAKPHGHGDVHALLHSEGVAKRWLADGVEWAVFFQDTNGLAFHTLPLMLGVSKKYDLIMNSMAVPRKAKQAVGGIVKLENGEGKKRTINVEYNQLDPLLRASPDFPDGDVNDAKTGYSPFPGNINQLLFSLEPYAKVLERTNGAMPEFVNPKYKDDTKTAFKKPTRLECMMQDFPTVLEGDDAERAGFTSAAAEMCFSPVKNATMDGAALQKKGTHPGVAASGEADQYCAIKKIMQSIGCKVEEPKATEYNGISVVLGPALVLKPDFVSCPGEYKAKFPSPSDIKISSRSSLIVNGKDVVIKSLDLDGALVIKCEDGASGTIEGLVVKNKGWEFAPVESSADEVIGMRGYELKKNETKTVTVKKDGTIEGMPKPVAKPAAKKPQAAAPAAAATKAAAPAPPKTAPAKRTARDLPSSLSDPAPAEAKQKVQTCACVIM